MLNHQKKVNEQDSLTNHLRRLEQLKDRYELIQIESHSLKQERTETFYGTILHKEELDTYIGTDLPFMMTRHLLNKIVKDLKENGKKSMHYESDEKAESMISFVTYLNKLDKEDFIGLLNETKELESQLSFLEKRLEKDKHEKEKQSILIEMKDLEQKIKTLYSFIKKKSQFT